MPRLSHAAALSLALLSTHAVGCSHATPKTEHTRVVMAGRSEPLILAWSQGERRVRRPPPSALSTLGVPSILKIDARNGGAPEFVLLMEDIPPTQAIPFHRHPHADEILFIYAGTGVVTLGNREATVASGATIYMPRNAGVGRIGSPRAENDEYLMAIGISGDLSDALRAATTDLARWLEADYGLNDPEVAVVLGTSMRYNVAELVGSEVSIVAKIPKIVLRQLRRPAAARGIEDGPFRRVPP